MIVAGTGEWFPGRSILWPVQTRNCSMDVFDKELNKKHMSGVLHSLAINM